MDQIATPFVSSEADQATLNQLVSKGRVEPGFYWLMRWIGVFAIPKPESNGRVGIMPSLWISLSARITLLCYRLIRADKLNTHQYGSFCTRPPVNQARLLSQKLVFHFTPATALDGRPLLLNIAEIGFSTLARQCLNRRVGSQEELARQVELRTAESNGGCSRYPGVLWWLRLKTNSGDGMSRSIRLTNHLIPLIKLGQR